MFWTIFLTLLVLAFGAHLLGRWRSLALVSGDHAALHSLPGYHGFWLGAVSIGPALLLFLLWSAFAPAVEHRLVFNELSFETASFSVAQREGLWRDILTLANGGAVATNDALRQRGLEVYGRIHAYSATLRLAAVLVLVLVGALVGWRAIAPRFRARQAVELLVRIALFVCAAIAVLTTFGIVLSLVVEAARFFSFVSPLEFLFGLQWSPQQMAFRADQVGGVPAFGFVPLLTGTLLITAIAMVVAAPLGLLAAIYLSDYASPSVRAVGKPVLEMLAGIPTVVYGFFAALTVAPFIRGWGESLGLSVSSESALAAGVVMGIMILPFVSSLSDDVINAVPQSLRDGSLALGSTSSETITRVVLPAALPGIVSALILAMSRAIGETMIVVMAAGLAANLTLNPLDAVTTITVQIQALLTGDQEFDSPKTLSAFALGLVLFLITLTLNMFALRVVNKYREQYD